MYSNVISSVVLGATVMLCDTLAVAIQGINIQSPAYSLPIVSVEVAAAAFSLRAT